MGGVTITAPTVSAPALVMDVKYTVNQEVSAPTAEELTNLGNALGATVEIANVSVETVAATNTTSPSAATSSAHQQLAFTLPVVFVACATFLIQEVHNINSAKHSHVVAAHRQ